MYLIILYQNINFGIFWNSYWTTLVIATYFFMRENYFYIFLHTQKFEYNGSVKLLYLIWIVYISKSKILLYSHDLKYCPHFNVSAAVSSSLLQVSCHSFEYILFGNSPSYLFYYVAFHFSTEAGFKDWTPNFHIDWN